MIGGRRKKHMPRKTAMPHVKTVRSKGRTYHYFDTGRRNANGAKVYAKLPPKDSPSFGATYAVMVGHRNRGAAGDPALIVPKLIDLFEKSPRFRKYAAGTQRVYRIYLDVFRDQFATAPAGEVARKDIRVLINKRAETPGAANLLLATIAALYRWARDEELLQNDPCKGIAEFETGSHEPWADDLLQEALASDDDRVRLSTHVLYYTALRIEDAANLRWGDIRDGAVHVVPQKTKKSRPEGLVIPVHRSLDAELDRHPKTMGTILERGAQTIRKALQEFAAERGHEIVPHGLRKNAVNALLEAGCSVPQAAAISGQTMQLVEYYARRRDQAKLGSAAILLWEKDARNKNG
jgi:integrase